MDDRHAGSQLVDRRSARWNAVLCTIILAPLLLVGITAPGFRRFSVAVLPQSIINSLSSSSPNHPQNEVRIIQLQGPPGLKRKRDGTWRHDGHLMCQSLLTAAYHGIELTVLSPGSGWGIPAPLYDMKSPRMAGMARYLKDVPDGTIVAFVDAVDTFFMHSMDDIRRQLQKLPLNDSVVFAGERQCYPHKSCPVDRPAPTTYKFVNSGGVVGRAGPSYRQVLEAWRRCTLDGHPDQRCANWLYEDFTPAHTYSGGRKLPISLDHQCHFFQTAWGSRLESGPGDLRFLEFEHGRQWVVNGQIVNPETLSTPSIIHFNGGKFYMDYYFKVLFPGLTWDHPQVKDWSLTLWGERIKGSELCIENVTYKHIKWPKQWVYYDEPKPWNWNSTIQMNDTAVPGPST